jgi:hypothetical protein
VIHARFYRKHVTFSDLIVCNDVGTEHGETFRDQVLAELAQDKVCPFAAQHRHQTQCTNSKRRLPLEGVQCKNRHCDAIVAFW